MHSSGVVSSYFEKEKPEAKVMSDEYWEGLEDFDLEKMLDDSTTRNKEKPVDAPYVPCNHICKDKQSCHHQCCKTGAKNTRKRRNADARAQQSDQNGETKKRDRKPRDERKFMSLAEFEHQTKKIHVQNDMFSSDSDTVSDWKQEAQMWKAGIAKVDRPVVNTKGKEKERRTVNDEKAALDELHSLIPQKPIRVDPVEAVLPSENIGGFSKTIQSMFNDECELEFEDSCQMTMGPELARNGSMASTISIQDEILELNELSSECDQLEASQQQSDFLSGHEDIIDDPSSVAVQIVANDSNVDKPVSNSAPEPPADLKGTFASTMKSILSEFIF